MKFEDGFLKFENGNPFAFTDEEFVKKDEEIEIAVEALKNYNPPKKEIEEFKKEIDPEFIKYCRKCYVEDKIKHLEALLAFCLEWYREWIEKDYPYFFRERPMNDALRVMGNIKKHKWELRWIENPELAKGQITPEMIGKAKEFPIKTLLNAKSDFVKCPFHNESNASFYLKGNFGHCFGCGITVDAIDLCKKLYNLSFKDAVLKLQ